MWHTLLTVTDTVVHTQTCRQNTYTHIREWTFVPILCIGLFYLHSYLGTTSMQCLCWGTDPGFAGARQLPDMGAGSSARTAGAPNHWHLSDPAHTLYVWDGVSLAPKASSALLRRLQALDTGHPLMWVLRISLRSSCISSKHFRCYLSSLLPFVIFETVSHSPG